MSKSVADGMEKILNRIRKMLAMAEGQADANESAVAASMAEKLMRKYNLQHADVLLEELSDDKLTDFETSVAYGGSVPTWIATLIVPCAHLHDCEARYNFKPYLSKGQTKMKKVITFLGEMSDVTVCAWVLEYLMQEIRRHTNAYTKSVGPDCTRIQTATFRRYCALEVAHTVRRMQREKEKDLQSHATGTALVIRKRDMIAEKYEVEYSKGGKRRHDDLESALAGQAAGKSISVRKGIQEG